LQHEQRLAALAVRRVFAGATLPAALAAVADDAHPRGDALVQELAYGTLRHWGRLAALTEALATKPLADLPLAALIAVAIYQLDHAHAPAFAVVDPPGGPAGRLRRSWVARGRSRSSTRCFAAICASATSLMRKSSKRAPSPAGRIRAGGLAASKRITRNIGCRFWPPGTNALR
jgi:hypothetical protein